MPEHDPDHDRLTREEALAELAKLRETLQEAGRLLDDMSGLLARADRLREKAEQRADQLAGALESVLEVVDLITLAPRRQP